MDDLIAKMDDLAGNQWIQQNKEAVSMKNLLLLILLGGTVIIHPTLPGTDVRDWNQPSIVIRDNQVYQTLPGTDVRDWNKGGYRIEGTIIPIQQEARTSGRRQFRFKRYQQRKYICE
jgi:hypothetical protein